MTEQQPMTAEQMAEIVQRVAVVPLIRAKFGTDGAVSISRDYQRDVPSLLAEVQRQQGEIERLKVVSEQARIDVEVIEGKIDGMYATQARLQAENDQLRQQLEEAVEALRRIEAESMDSRLSASDALEEIERLKGDRTDG